MKQIIATALAISILLGAYGYSKTNHEQPTVEITIGDAPERPTEVAGEQTDTPQPTSLPARPTADMVATDRPSDYQILMGKKNGHILWRIYTLESSQGKRDGCKKQGKVNGFGYRQNAREHVCFDYFEEVAYYVDIWLEEKLKDHDLATALCGYNLGFQSENLPKCVAQDPRYPYWKNYLSL